MTIKGFLIPGFIALLLVTISACETSITENKKRYEIVNALHELQTLDIQKYDENKFYARMNMYIEKWNNQKRILNLFPLIITSLGVVIGVLQKFKKKFIPLTCAVLGGVVSILTVTSEYWYSEVSREQLNKYINEAISIKKDIKKVINPPGNLTEEQIREYYDLNVREEIRERVDALNEQSLVDPIAHTPSDGPPHLFLVPALYAAPFPERGVHTSSTGSSLVEARDSIYLRGRHLLYSNIDTIYSQELTKILNSRGVQTDSVSIYKPSENSDFIYPQGKKSYLGNFRIDKENINFKNGEYTYDAEIFIDTTYTRKYIMKYQNKYWEMPVERV